jgi:hypothetical protein
MAVHKAKKQILFLKDKGEFCEDFQEVHHEVNCNCKPERLQFFKRALATAASSPVLFPVSSRYRTIHFGP